jgi:hypothetical protein
VLLSTRATRLDATRLRPAPPAHDPVDRESDENDDSERRKVDGWTGIRGENRGYER